MCRLSENNHQGAFSIHPNPFKESINLEINSPLDKSTIKSVEIYSSLGKLIDSFDVSDTISNLKELNLEHLQSGMYFIQFQFADTLYIRKVIKE